MSADIGWSWWPAGVEPVRVLDRRLGWGGESVVVAVPSTGVVETLPAEELTALGDRRWQIAELTWRASTGRALNAAATGGSSVAANRGIEPLPHQLAALEKTLGTVPVRMLLALPTGLGKTIVAGMVLTELAATSGVDRVLVACPKGIQLQWVAEMREKFQLEFALVGAGGVPVDTGIDPWTVFPRVVCSLDTIKPVQQRRGWTPERVAAHNEQRFNAVLSASWDVVIFDECHHVAGADDNVARHRLAKELAAAVPHVLLLSATPHNGKSATFGRLLGLIDDRFAHGLPLTRESVSPIVVRADKASTVDAEGNALFPPQTTDLLRVPYGERIIEEHLYEAVTSYVRHGWARAKSEKRPAIGFLVMLMQRLVSSSTAALLGALEKRLAAVVAEGTQLQLFPDSAAEWGDLTSEEQVEALRSAVGAAWQTERSEVEVLIDLARRAQRDGTDAKARLLLDLIGRTAREEGDPSVKLLVFTEFVETQTMLIDLLGDAGIPTVAINGSMSLDERSVAQQSFRHEARVLVSTDAGGEGLNLQFCHLVANYDLPYSPSKLVQRAGRAWRIGQHKPVRIFNLVMENTVDARVIEILETKLAVIREEMGEQRAGDVLQSADAHALDLYAAAAAGEDVDATAIRFEQETRTDLANSSEFLDLADITPPTTTLRPDDPTPWWERAAEAALTAGRTQRPGALPEIVPGEPIPEVSGPLDGLWTLWEVAAEAGTRVCVALFRPVTGGPPRPDVAERMWTQIAAGPDAVSTGPPLSGEEWGNLRRFGLDYAWRPELTDPISGAQPALALRLAVRVCT